MEQKREKQDADTGLKAYMKESRTSYQSGYSGVTRELTRQSALIRIDHAAGNRETPQVGEYLEAILLLPRGRPPSPERCLVCYSTVAWAGRGDQNERLVGLRIYRMQLSDVPPDLKQGRPSSAIG